MRKQGGLVRATGFDYFFIGSRKMEASARLQLRRRAG
jgi:hypothetical protein